MNSITKLCCASAIAAFAILLLSPSVASAHNFSGTWAFSGTIGHEDIETMSGVCTLTQDGAEIVGSCKGPDGVSVADGTVDGLKIVLSVHHVATGKGGVKGIALFKGILSDDGIIRGTWTDSPRPGLTGPFTGQQVK
jgi:hypothetical protein